MVKVYSVDIPGDLGHKSRSDAIHHLIEVVNSERENFHDPDLPTLVESLDMENPESVKNTCIVCATFAAVTEMEFMEDPDNPRRWQLLEHGHLAYASSELRDILVFLRGRFDHWATSEANVELWITKGVEDDAF